MATGDERDGPVRRFCDELSEYVRQSGLRRADVARGHPMSESQVYAVLRGEVRTPPPFDRMVTPIVKACGGDAERLAWWRARHAMMVREHQAWKQSREPVPAATPGEPERRPDRRALILTVALAVMAGVTVASILAAWLLTRPDEPAALPAPPAPPRCAAGPPEVGGDLLDVPHPTPADNHEFNDWWSTDGRVTLGEFDRHRWTASVRRGAAARPYDLIVIRGCLPVVKGARYALSFRARASADVTVGVKVQTDYDPWTPSLLENAELTTETATFRWDFPGAVTYSASELTFHLGGLPDHDVEVTDIALTLVSAP